MEDQVQVRLDKIAALRASGKLAYAERFERTHTLAEAAALPDGTARRARRGPGCGGAPLRQAYVRAHL